MAGFPRGAARATHIVFMIVSVDTWKLMKSSLSGSMRFSPKDTACWIILITTVHMSTFSLNTGVRVKTRTPAWTRR